MGKTLRIIGIIGVVGVIIAAIATSMTVKPSSRDKVWDEATTVGNLDAKNHFVIYSDIMCPYCVAFENAILEHEQEFKEYIEKNDILLEIRMSDFLYEYGEAQAINSRYSAEATYCAKREGKFWDYYDLAIKTVWGQYFKDGGKAAFTKLNSLDKGFWIGLGKEIGLGESFENCVTNDEMLDEIVSTSGKIAKVAQGMPYFKFNSYATSGFDLSWGWEYVLMYFDAGLKS